ncbi:FecCD family ABC transporter permease [Corynebacterium mendelii]
MAASGKKTPDTVLPRPGDIVFVAPTMRVRRWAVATTCCLLAAVAAAMIVALARGDYPLSPGQVIEVLTGGGDEMARTIVVKWRLARVLVALVIGLALGAAGALTQSIARNGLASPDILGISMGSSAAAVAVIVLGGSTVTVMGINVGVPAAALLGGLSTAAVIYLLALKNGVDTFRLVLIGIGVNACLGAVITWLLIIAELNRAEQAAVWMTGSLNGRGFEHLYPLAGVVSICFVVVAWAAFDLKALHLGRDISVALGVRVDLSQTILLLAAIAMTSATVAAAGPIGFVAFVAPQLARLMTKSPTPPVIAGAVTGAFILITADVVTSTVLPWTLPVGVATSAIGGPFLLGLIVAANKKITV